MFVITKGFRWSDPHHVIHDFGPGEYADLPERVKEIATRNGWGSQKKGRPPAPENKVKGPAPKNKGGGDNAAQGEDDTQDEDNATQGEDGAAETAGA